MNVITGGPCAGKTTLVNELRDMGHFVVQEAARAVLNERSGRDPLPFQDFQGVVLERQLNLERLAPKVRGTKLFLDRGTLDNIAYCRATGVETPRSLIDHTWVRAKMPYDSVFLLDRLDYEWEPGRRVGEDEVFANTVHHLIRVVYEENGYEVIEVPVMPPRDRALYVAERARKTR